MDVWGWIVLYVLLFAVLQLLLYRYLQDDEQAPLQSMPANIDPAGIDDHLGDVGEEADANLAEDRTRCVNCGAENDSAYTYCRQCVTPLLG